ncbi:MAG: MliC family protein [Actinomycetota bacterium]|nr:MliC family protein [Actinomycetota bacterium]
MGLRSLTLGLALATAATGTVSCSAPGPDSDTPPAASSSAAAPAEGCEPPVGQLICQDPEIAALDARLTDAFDRSLATADDPAAARAEQRGWASGRDDCWKGPDLRRCVLEAYQTRLIELQLPTLPEPPVVNYRCDDTATPLSARFYPDADPSAMVLTWGADSAILIQQRTASGIRYAREGAEYREHQGEVTVDFYGNRLNCTPRQ